MTSTSMWRRTSAKNTRSLCSRRSSGRVHATSHFSQGGTVGTALSLPVPAGLSQLASDKQQASTNHRCLWWSSANRDKRSISQEKKKNYHHLDLNCAFPPKIVIWDGVGRWGGQGSFCFLRNYGLFSSARLFPHDPWPVGSKRRISHSSWLHNVAFSAYEERHWGGRRQERERRREEAYRSIRVADKLDTPGTGCRTRSKSRGPQRKRRRMPHASRSTLSSAQELSHTHTHTYSQPVCAFNIAHSRPLCCLPELRLPHI